MSALPARILVVDDEASIRFLLKEVLTKEGYDVVCVESGEEALAKLGVEPFDLMVLDLKMPGLDGVEVMQVSQHRAPHTAVIVLTAHASLETAVVAVRAGASDYLLKPCHPDDIRRSVYQALIRQQRVRLLAEVEQGLAEGLRQLRQAGLVADSYQPEGELSPLAGEERFLQVNGLIIDFQKHVVTLGGRVLTLTPTEFQLLVTLARQPQRAFPCRELVKAVQGYDVEEREARALIRWHVHHLRRKLEPDPRRPRHIVNVRGVGYMYQPSDPPARSTKPAGG